MDRRGPETHRVERSPMSIVDGGRLPASTVEDITGSRGELMDHR
jgi:hypothetical protein